MNLTALLRFAFLGLLVTTGGAFSETLDAATASLLEESDPSDAYYVALIVSNHQCLAEAKALSLTKFSLFEFAGVVFTRVTASHILSWQTRHDIQAIDVIDENAAHTFFRVMTHLQTLARYDDLGILRPNVINISMGPVRALLGKNGSGEHAIRAALGEIVKSHKIPVVLSAGNDGPASGTINPWALGTNAIVVGATDASGTLLFERSSRFQTPAPSQPSLFVAEGVDTLGPRAGCRTKTKEEEQEDERGHLTARVGKGNEACWEIRSGTSFAAGLVTRMLCLVHQSIFALRSMNDPSTANDTPIPLPIFVRSYIDFDFDRSMTVFNNRLADSRAHFGPVSVIFPHALRQSYSGLIMQSSIDLLLKYEPDTVFSILKAAAKPVPGHGPSDVGYGFVSFDNLAAWLRSSRVSDLVDVLGGNDPRSAVWREVAKRYGDPVLFPLETLDPIVSYCQNNDLILGLPVSDE